MSLKRVVITGIGAVTPLGNSVAETWKALLDGKSGIAPISIFNAKSFPTKIAGEVKHFDFSKQKKLGRNSHFALAASQQAFDDAKLKNHFKPERFGVYFGAGDGGFNFPSYASIISKSILNGHEHVDAASYIRNTLQMADAQSLAEQEPQAVIRHLADHFGAEGIISNCLTACAASSQAIGESAEIIRGGEADVILTGGAHSMIHPLGVAGFNLLTALSTQNDAPQKASRPFDKARDGFVLAEGAGALILEELEHAKKRGATIYAELAGYGTTADAYRLTDPHSQGRGAISAMKLALENAQLSGKGVDYINAHGTSTQLNDQVETLAIKQVFGMGASSIPVSSIKSMLGHMIAAAGAVELIASVLTIREGIIPPTINYENPDPDCDLDYVPNHARKAKVDSVLSNSFGFGGQNVALVVKRFKD